MAGQKLATLPLENITQDLKEALANLNGINTSAKKAGIHRYYPVPKESVNVHWAADPVSSAMALRLDSARDAELVRGNRAELQKIRDANLTGSMEIAWGSELDDQIFDSRIGGGQEASTRGSLSDPYITGDTIRAEGELRNRRIALTARSTWDDFLQKIPDGTLLQNAPYGGNFGNYDRADLYMREGFGPVGSNYIQYAIKQNGGLTPVAPFGTSTEYAEHLRDRLKNMGNSELSQEIGRELQRREDQRQTLVTPKQWEAEQAEARERLEYEQRMRDAGSDPDDYYDEGPDYDYDYDYEYERERTPLDPDEMDFRLHILEDQVTEPGSTVNLTALANQLNDLTRAGGQLTADQVSRVRQMQEAVIDGPAGSMDGLNATQQFMARQLPRPVPMPITSSPYVPFDADAPAPRFDRTDPRTVGEFVDQYYENDGMVYEMPQSTPENLRAFAKRNFEQGHMTPDGVLVMHENYSPEDVQRLRDLQIVQALNPRSEGTGPNGRGISTPLTMLSSDVPVEWRRQDGSSRGPAAPITGAGGTERSMNMRRNNWEDERGLNRGRVIEDYNRRAVLQDFIDRAGIQNPERAFPGVENLAPPFRGATAARW